MLDTVRTAGRILARTWPTLLAWYLAGWLARYLVIEVASTIGVASTLGAFLVLPLAALARLVSFIAMFLVMRDAMPNYTALSGADRPRFMRAVLASILPFFVFYAAWGFLRDDALDYTRRALDKVDWFGAGVGEGQIDSLPFDAITVGVIAATFAARTLIKRLATKLPAWSSLIAAYCEAVWVFLTLYFIRDAIGGVTGWMNSRMAVHWWNEIVATIGDTFAWFDPVQQASGWVLNQLGDLILLPLAWLALAGIVFGQALGNVEYGRIRALERASNRFARLPEWSRRRLTDVGLSSLGRWKTISDAMLLIWRAGAAPMSLYVLAYTLVLAGDRWLSYAIGHLAGPQERTTWQLIDTPLSVVTSALVEPILLVLVAAAYDYCLGSISSGTRTKSGSSATTEITSSTSPVSAGTMNGNSST
jgi:hypothetical protein